MGYTQPPFDPRIYARHGLLYSRHTHSSALNRGAIARADGSAKMNFLYNPTTVTADYALQMDQAAAVLFNNPQDTGTRMFPLQQHVQFNVLFDRTYELWDSKYLDTLQGKYGAEVDVAALKNVVGMEAPPGAIPNGSPGSSGTYDVTQAIRVWIYIGGGAVQSLKYYGFIDSFTVTYTHWSQDTIPMRCAIAIHATLLPRTSAGGVQGGGAASSTSSGQTAPNSGGGKTSTTGPSAANPGKGGR